MDDATRVRYQTYRDRWTLAECFAHDLLDVAFRDYLKQIRIPKGTPQSITRAMQLMRNKDTAIMWLNNDEYSIFSYTYCCDVCGIDPVQYRKRLIEADRRIDRREELLLRRQLSRQTILSEIGDDNRNAMKARMNHFEQRKLDSSRQGYCHGISDRRYALHDG